MCCQEKASHRKAAGLDPAVQDNPLTSERDNCRGKYFIRSIGGVSVKLFEKLSMLAGASRQISEVGKKSSSTSAA